MDFSPPLLLVDDREDDLTLMELALQRVRWEGAVQQVRDGAEAISYLAGESIYANRQTFPFPAVMLLDLNMPDTDGFAVLSWWKARFPRPRLTIAVLTASMRTEDVERAFALGAHSFLVKPPTFGELVALVGSLRDWRKLDHFSRLTGGSAVGQDGRERPPPA